MQHELGAKGARQPLLRDELVALSTPTQVWSRRDGSMQGPADGLFHGDWRWVRGLELLVDGRPVEHLSTAEEHGSTVFRAVARDAGSGAASMMVERTRAVHPGSLVERVTVVNGSDAAIPVLVELRLELGLAPLATVRDGSPAPVAVDAALVDGRLEVTDGVRTLRCSSPRGSIDIDGERVTVSRSATVRAGDWVTLALEIEIDDPQLAVLGPLTASFPEPRATGVAALDRWTARSVADLEDLSLDAGHGPFPVTAVPWQMTLLAREALVAARLTLPEGAALAEGTLRTLATRQGALHVAATGEEPGRIPHELRLDAGVPVAVFGASVEATPLWIVLLHDTWKAGMPTETAHELRTALHAGLGWLAMRIGDGFLADEHDDAVHAAVQATVHRAAVGAAELLDALGDDGGEWRARAARLRRRFREAFWRGSGSSRRPIRALDRHGVPLDGVGADLGHLVGTGILDRDEEAIVASLLLDSRLSSGFGLRSLEADDACYWPMLERGGAIHPRETGVAIEGLLRAGRDDEARALAAQLLAAAEAFGGRLPAAFAGYGTEDVSSPVPLPAPGGPHAASAAVAVVAHRALDVRPRSTRGERPERHLTAVERHHEGRAEAAQRRPAAQLRMPARTAAGGADVPRRPQLRLVDPQG